MPWRLIGLAIVFVVFLTFIGFNLNNRCDISFVFWEIKELPVFLPIFTSFVLGLLCSIPFAVSIGRKGAKKNKTGESPLIDIPAQSKKEDDFPGRGPYGID
ncbi:hypothetical protein FACS189445_2720 [Spirochaetia bacterium]|nr:hypothetical protein FACS189445_2720 [Spirochaetia bacterium]